MSKYDEALEGFKEFTGLDKSDFDEFVEKLGKNFITYYYNRRKKHLENQNKRYTV